MRKVALVSPTYYDVVYSINPWMNTEVKVNKTAAIYQWEEVKAKLEEFEIQVIIIESVANFPDMVFAANAGMRFGEKYIVSKFRDFERQGESIYYANAMRKLGFSVFKLVGNDSIWEGEACSVFLNDIFLCAIGTRSNIQAYKEIANLLNLNTEKMKLIDLIDPYFYHLDVCLCKLNESTVMYCPLAFKRTDNNWIRQQVKNVIEVSYEDALNFACNAYCAKNVILLNKGISKELRSNLRNFGFKIIEINVNEFIKAGGGVKCLICTL